MKAMILAAGLGTRLKELTGNLPKALVPVEEKPMLEWILLMMKKAGIIDVIINVHHFPELITDFLARNNNFGMNLSISDESDRLLDTGGGLMKASWFFDDGEPFLLHNVDVISDVDFDNLLEVHLQRRALATLAVSRRNTNRQFLFSDDRLCGWENLSTGEKIIKIEKKAFTQRAFSGIHIISPEIFNHIKMKGKFSMTEVYLGLCAGHYISGFEHNADKWLDLGKPEALPRAEILIKELFKE